MERSAEPCLLFSLKLSVLCRAVAFSADGRFLATASNDKSVRLWAIQDGKVTQVGGPLLGHSLGVRYVCACACGMCVVLWVRLVD